jgi:hypothetical protein
VFNSQLIWYVFCTCLRERSFKLRGVGVMVFCFVHIKNFGQHELEYLFLLSRKARNFFPEFHIRLYDKTSESDYFFFPPPKSEYFFQQHWESEYFFRKNHNPPFKLNGRSLSVSHVVTHKLISAPYCCFTLFYSQTAWFVLCMANCLNIS